MLIVDSPSPGKACKECPPGKYKGTSGDGMCDICPPNSRAAYSGSVECK